MNPAHAKQPLTRQKLLEAAFAEIHRHGFQAASLAQILSDTGLTKGALYHHFPDKKALGLAVVEEIIRPRLAAALFEPLRGAGRPLAALQSLLTAKAAESDSGTVALGCPLSNLTQEMSPVDEDFRQHLNRLFQDWVDAVRQGLLEGQATGEVRATIDAGETALFIVSALEGCIGMSKNAQSATVYRSCLMQLSQYLESLKC